MKPVTRDSRPESLSQFVLLMVNGFALALPPALQTTLPVLSKSLMVAAPSLSNPNTPAGLP